MTNSPLKKVQSQRRSPSPQSKVEGRNDGIDAPKGIVTPPSPKNPVPPVSELQSPFDEGDLKQLGNSTTPGVQELAQKDTATSAGTPTATGVENQPPVTTELSDEIAAADYLDASIPSIQVPGVASKDFAPDPTVNNTVDFGHRDSISEDRLTVGSESIQLSPRWIRHSPAGFHIEQWEEFRRSDLIVPPSPDPDLRKYADDGNENPRLAIIAYNRSREYDRICPACLTWFRVGENVFQNTSNWEQFRKRPLNLADYTQREGIIPLQLAGCCGPVCDKILRHPENEKLTKRICKEATNRRPTFWTWWSNEEIPTPPAGIEVKPAEAADKALGFLIGFVPKARRPSLRQRLINAIPGKRPTFN